MNLKLNADCSMCGNHYKMLVEVTNYPALSGQPQAAICRRCAVLVLTAFDSDEIPPAYRQPVEGRYFSWDTFPFRFNANPDP